MTLIDVFQLIVGVAMLFWGIWHANVQLERLNKDVFEKTKSYVIERLKTSTGIFRIIGVVLY